MLVHLLIGGVNFGVLVTVVFVRFPYNKILICPFIILSNLKELNFKVIDTTSTT